SKGWDIVNAIFDDLEGGLDGPGGQMLPDIGLADDILFVGSSAGSNGIRHNADRIRERLTAANPDLVFRAVTDSSFLPVTPAAQGIGNTAAQQEHEENGTVLRPDESCVENHPENAVVCLDNGFLQLNHITTPFFMRMDLMDPNAHKHVDRERFPTRAALAQALHDQVMALQDILGPNGAIEREQMTTQPGAFAPLCGAHIALTGDFHFFDPELQSGGAETPLSFHDVLWNWMQGDGPAFQIADKPPLSPPIPQRDLLCAPQDASAEFVSVSSASFAPGDPVAPDSIVSGFGSGLATGTFSATTLPLPTELGGTSVEVTDSEGTTRLAPLFFVSAVQINYLIPPETAPGLARITVRTPTGGAVSGLVEIVRVAPGLYTADSTGAGVAAAFFLHVAADGTRTQELVYNPVDLSPVPIDLGEAGDQVFLILFGTGFRAGADGQLRARVGGVPVPVLGVAAQVEFEGLDQAAVGPLPMDLDGSGPVTVELEVGGEKANPVGVVIGSASVAAGQACETASDCADGSICAVASGGSTGRACTDPTAGVYDDGSGPSLQVAGDGWVRKRVDDWEAQDLRCNDGSPYAYYVSRGMGEGADKWLFFFKGGAACADDEQCALRWAIQPQFMRQMRSVRPGFTPGPQMGPGAGLFARDQQSNYFADWNYVYLHYCSSDVFSGTLTAAEGTTGFHFRGRPITEAVVAELLDGIDPSLPRLADASEVVVAGGSAGAAG
ncbi:MAG: hypothetical protein GY953_22685, partial [bacterium]|nr:hypothetical protein [bacterium]